jgi:protein tyrosine phosphatase
LILLTKLVFFFFFLNFKTHTHTQFIEYITGISLDQLKDCTLLANQVKNRYANVVAPDPSRVRLSGVSPNDYINANWIPGRVPSSEKRYIGAQGPLPNTVEDFWRMVFETNVSVIVMLTQVIENERVKCEPYWPDGDTPAIMYGQVTVRLIASQVTPEVTTRTFDLTHPSMNNAQRRVTHLQYTEWPDFGQPSSCAAFLSLVTNVDTVNNTSGPLLTHCSAGIGRTGTFIVVHAVLEEYRYYHQKKLPLTFNLIEVLTRIRAARPGMVQTKDQLQFCYRALCEAIGAYNDVHGPPAKVRTVTVKPLPPSDRPPAAVLAAASKIDIVPYSETDAAKRRTSDDSDDESSSSSSSGDAAADRRRRERGSRSSKSRSSSGDPRRRRHDRRSGGGGGRSRDPRDRSRDGGRSSSNGGSPARTSSSRAGSAAAASPSVLDQALAEAKSKVKANANKSVFLDV